MSRNENNTDSGNVTQMTKALRTCQRIKKTARAAMISSSSIARFKVSMAP